MFVNGKFGHDAGVKQEEIVVKMSVFGRNLRRARVVRGLTQEKLAERADLNPRTLQKIEAGEINLLVTTVMRLRRALGCKWEELMIPEAE